MAEDKQQHLYDLLRDFDTAMMVTHTKPDSLRARPMAVADLQPDADAYFVTSIDSPKIEEIERNPDVLLTFQSSTKFAAVTGTVTIVRDRVLIDRLWRETWRVWFPRGKDDPTLCLIRFDAHDGEYWDIAGVKGINYLFAAMKAYAGGEQPKIDESQHAKLKL